MYMNEKTPTFSARLSDLRKAINMMDWSPDGVNLSQNYKFLSNQKMKANVSKALVEVGLNWYIEFTDLEVLPPVGDRMAQHYKVKAEAHITDTTSDETIIWTAFGEAADSGDKGISKAQTNAFKNLIANNLMVSEYDAETESEMVSTDDMKAKGVSGYDAKKEIAKAKVLNRNPVENPVERPPAQRTMTTTQSQAMAKIIAKVRTLDETTLAPFGTMDGIEMEYHAVQTTEQAAQFIGRFKGVLTLE